VVLDFSQRITRDAGSRLGVVQVSDDAGDSLAPSRIFESNVARVPESMLRATMSIRRSGPLSWRQFVYLPLQIPLIWAAVSPFTPAAWFTTTEKNTTATGCGTRLGYAADPTRPSDIARLVVRPVAEPPLSSRSAAPARLPMPLPGGLTATTEAGHCARRRAATAAAAGANAVDPSTTMLPATQSGAGGLLENGRTTSVTTTEATRASSAKPVQPNV
jgi:hypothetical protein